MRSSPDPPWYWKPWLGPWFMVRDWWFREREVKSAMRELRPVSLVPVDEAEDEW